MADIRIVVDVDTKAGTAEIKALDSAVENLGKTTDKSGKTWVETMKGFISAQVIIGAAKKVWRELTDVVSDSIKAAVDAEAADSLLRATLQVTGREVDVLGKHFADYASELQRTTVFDDEAIKGAQALMLQLTSLDRQGIDRATRGAIGLASALKIDLQSAAMLVAKAMEGNTGALGRYGIKIEETLPLEEKREQLLSRLESMYKLAGAETETFGGMQKQLKNSLSEVLETVGKTITENETFRKGMKDLKKMVDDLATSSDFKLWLNTVVDGLIAAAKAAAWLGRESKELMDKVFGATKADKEAAASLDKLNASRARAAVAGHTYAKMQADMAAATAREEAEIRKATAAADAHSTGYKNAVAAVKTMPPALDAAMKSQAAMIKTTHGAVVTEKELEAQLKKTGKATDDVRRETVELASAYAPLADAVARYGSMALSVVGQIDAVSQQAYTNATVRIDNEYNRRKIAIINSLMNEKDKAAALEVLEAEVEVKKREAMRDAASANKAVAMMGAIVNTAMAVTRALAAAPPPWNIALAAISAALGAAQIALIAAEPVPFKKGLKAGPIDKPTLALLGEGGEREWVATDRQLRQIVNNNYGPRRQQTVLKVFIGGDEFDAKVVEAVQRADRSGKLKIGKAYA